MPLGELRIVVCHFTGRETDQDDSGRSQGAALLFYAGSRDGRIFAPNLLIALKTRVLQVDKPLDWDEKLTDFRLFFRRNNDLWFGFRVQDFDIHPFTLSFPPADEICFLQRRQSPGITVPCGTRAMLRKIGKFISALFVRDTSNDGMLICSGSKAFGIDFGANLQGI